MSQCPFKPGDKVTIRGQSGWQRDPKIATRTVAAVGKAFITLSDDSKWHLTRLRPWGSRAGWHDSCRLEPWKPEHSAEIRRDCKAQAIAAKLRGVDWSKVPLEQLEAVERAMGWGDGEGSDK